LTRPFETPGCRRGPAGAITVAAMRTTWRLLAAAFGLILWTHAGSASAQTPDTATPQELRRQIDVLKADVERLQRDYQDRIGRLEVALAALQSAPPVPEAALPPAPPAPGSSKVFNPDTAVIGNFLGTAGRNAVSPSPAFEMRESEVSFQAAVDPYARADFFLSFAESGVNLEEGFVTFSSLPGGLLAKAGKMRAAFGKVNAMHTHVLPWADRPLVTANLLGGEDGINDAGVSVARLIPNRWLFVEATGQVFRGDSQGVFAAATSSDLAYVGHVRAYRDLTENSNLDLGVSYARGRAVGAGTSAAASNATSALVGVDATWHWRPLRRALYRSFVGRSEFAWNHRSQPLGSARGVGFYLSGDYQFARRWFGGARYDRSDRAANLALEDRGTSLMLTFRPSEFSQLRGQYRRTAFADAPTANDLLFQLQFAIGAHGAHAF